MRYFSYLFLPLFVNTIIWWWGAWLQLCSLNTAAWMRTSVALDGITSGIRNDWVEACLRSDVPNAVLWTEIQVYASMELPNYKSTYQNTLNKFVPSLLTPRTSFLYSTFYCDPAQSNVKEWKVGTGSSKVHHPTLFLGTKMCLELMPQRIVMTALYTSHLPGNWKYLGIFVHSHTAYSAIKGTEAK